MAAPTSPLPPEEDPTPSYAQSEADALYAMLSKAPPEADAPPPPAASDPAGSPDEHAP